MRRLLRIEGLLAVAICGCVVVASSANAQAPASPNDAGAKVGAYLREMGLTRIAAVHVENELRRAREPARQKALSRELADLYAELLTATGVDEQEYARRSAALDRIVKEFPAVDSPSLAIIRVQGEFQRGEEALNLWLADPNDQQRFATAKSVFDRVGPELAAASLRLDAERKALQTQIDAATEPNPELDRQFERTSEAWNRAHFFAGWAEYYRWIVSDRGSAAPLESSIAAFERFLGLVGEKYIDVKPEWLALEVPYRSRGAIGLELALIGLGDGARADFVHQWLQHFSVAPSLRDELPNWRLSGYLNARRWVDAANFAEATLSGFSPEPTQGKVSFCATLLRAAYATPDVPPTEKRRFADLGVERLARMRVFNVLNELVERYKITDFGAGGGFYLQFLSAKRAFDAAEKSKAPADYELAIEGLNAALKTPEAKQDAGVRGEALYSLAWSYYRTDRTKEAAENFEASWNALRDAARESAGEAAWMAFVAYYELGKTDKSYYDSALSALERIVAEMPETETGRKAQQALPRLRAMASPPTEAMATWKRIAPTDPRFDEAQREIARLYGRMSAEAKSDADRQRIGKEAAAFVAGALDATLTPATKLEVGLLGARVAALATPPDWNAASASLDRVAAAVGATPATSATAREWHSLRMTAAAKTGDDDKAKREAAWLVENASGTPFERSAYVLQAQNAAAWGIADDRLDEIYGKIAGGASPTTLADDKNARAATYRLAVRAEKAGDLEQAETHISRLLAAFPSERDYLLLQARILFASKKYPQARETAIKLIRDLRDDDPRWWEMKRLQIAALLETDPEGAAKVYAQFRLLYPEIKDATVRAQFEELAARLPSPSGAK